MSFLSGALF